MQEEAPQLHTMSISADDYYNGGNHVDWQWLPHLLGNWNTQIASGDVNTHIGAVNLVSGLRHLTGSVSQVLWGYNPQAWVTNGRATAPP